MKTIQTTQTLQELKPTAEILKTYQRKDFTSQGVKSFVFMWNNLFPIDYWFRQKYKLAFNSKQHRKTCLLNVYFEHMEEKEFRKLKNQHIETQERKANFKKTGSILVETRYDKTRENQLFEDLNFTTLNK